MEGSNLNDFKKLTGRRPPKVSLGRLIMCSLMAMVWHLFAFESIDLAEPAHFQSSVSADSLTTESLPFPSSPMTFEATAYCDSGITKSGVPVERGIVAGDPRVLPLGTIIDVDVSGYAGIYQVLDTGGLVKGRIIDLYMPDECEALKFGRRKVKITVLRYGYSPSDSTLVD